MIALSNTGGFTIAGSDEDGRLFVGWRCGIKKQPLPFDLMVTDIDNTVFDWVQYYVHSIWELFEFVSKTIHVPVDVLAEQAKDVFTRHGSIEYPFLIQELDAVNQFFGADIDAMLEKAVRIGRERFLQASTQYLKPYDGVIAAFAAIKSQYPDLPIVALTDAPRYVAMWKLNKLGLLSFFDAVYGLEDPRIPTCEINHRVKVDPDILLKHLRQSNFGFTGKIRILPDDYEKPGVRGLKTVLMDYELDETPQTRDRVLWIGDNLRKDVGLGNRLGVQTAWAEYGTRIDPANMKRLVAFSPTENVHKNVYIKADSPESPKPRHTLSAFSDVLRLLSEAGSS